MARFIFILVGLALFIYVAIQLGPGATLSMLLRVGWGFLTVAVIYSGYQLARAAALSKCVLKPQFASLRNVVGIRISGEAVQFLTFTGPFLAEPAKAWLLKKQGLSTQEGFAATVTEYLIYTFTSAALSLAGLTYLALCLTLDRALLIATLALIVAMVLFLLVSTIAIVFRMYLIGSIIQGIAHLPLVRNRLRPNMETVHRFEDLLLEVLHEHPGRLLRIVTAELLAQALLLFEIYWILNTLDLSFPMVYPLVIEAAGKLVSLAFFFIPTQLGATEGTYAIVFNALDMPAAAGFTLAVVRRIRSLLVAGAGLVALWLLTPEKRQSDHGLTDGEP